MYLMRLFENIPIINAYRERVSVFAGDIDALFAMIMVVVGFWFVLTEGMFFWLMFRYRARPGVPAQYITGKEKHLKRWVSIPHLLIILCDVFVIFFAVQVWYNVKQTTPEEDYNMEIDIIAQQWAWTFVHPGPDNILEDIAETNDVDESADNITTIDELTIETDRMVYFNLKSNDVLHDFSVPVLRLKQDAIPGRVIKGWFKATKTGDFDIQCAEMCGIGHGIMGAKIHIKSKEDHEAWVKKHSGA